MQEKAEKLFSEFIKKPITLSPSFLIYKNINTKTSIFDMKKLILLLNSFFIRNLMIILNKLLKCRDDALDNYV